MQVLVVKILTVQRKNGFSLVELMVAITLGLILTAGVLQLFMSNTHTFRTQQTTSRIQESGRLAIDFLAQDIRMAGYTGFRGRLSAVSNQVVPVGYSKKYINGIEFINDADSVKALGAKANTNILVLRGAVDGVGAMLTKPAEAKSLTVALVSTEANGCALGVPRFNGLCVGKNAYIADYQKTFVFTVTGLANNGSELTVSYAGAWGGNNEDPDEYFVEGAVVSPAREMAYFIADGASGQPSLFQKVDDEAAVELLEGVANLSLFYNRDQAKNNYINALNAMDGLWNDQLNPIVSVRLELLLRSVADNVLDEKQTYSFNGEDTKAGDNRLYKIFATTIALRNQLP